MTLIPNGWELGVITGNGNNNWPSNPADQRYKICRYQFDANRNGYVWSPNQTPAANDTTKMTAIDNAEHPYAYVRVTGGLSNQNYLVIRGTANCPKDNTSLEINGQGQETYTDAATFTHQP